MSERPDALEDLRRQFAAAAGREIRPRRRRHHRRALAVAFAAVLSAGVVAQAVNQVTTGDPVPSVPDDVKHWGVPAFGGRVAVTAEDPESPLPFAVVTYRREGKPCAIAGQLRGNALGELQGGTFHSFEGRLSGACGNGVSPFFADRMAVDGRALLYGRAERGITHMVARVQGEVSVAKVGRGGAFLFVLDGDTPLAIDLEARPQP